MADYDPYTLIRNKELKVNLTTKNPIPGYTGYIPGIILLLYYISIDKNNHNNYLFFKYTIN